MGSRSLARAHRLAAVLFGVVVVVALAVAPAAQANGVPLSPGQVLADIGHGQIKHLSPSGATLDTLDTTTGTNEGDGMCLDGSTNLYATQGFSAETVSKFNQGGNLLTANFGSGYDGHPESCVVDGANNIYVGQPDGSTHVLKFNSSGTPIGSFAPATQGRGTDWVDLAADQCTLSYTSEGTSIKRFNVCTNTQLPDFATGLPHTCFAHRIMPDGGELAACTNEVIRLNASGTVTNTYGPFTGVRLLFAMNLDPDGTTFWTADYFSGKVYRVSLASSGPVTTPTFTVTPNSFLGGLSIIGEPTAAQVKHPTSTTVSCTPNPVKVSKKATCTATVTDTGSGTKTTPTGSVSLSHSGKGTLSATSCALAAVSTGVARCSVTFKTGSVGSGKRTISAGYPGDSKHTSSSGSTVVRVKAAAKKCVVPKLKGKTVAQARKLLKKHHCKLGKVTTKAGASKRTGKLHIVSQSVKAKSVHSSGKRVPVVIDRTGKPVGKLICETGFPDRC
jgi:Bacterial Ig-like domain (group 3)/PASTA domain